MSRNLTALDLADHARTETAEVMAIGSSKNIEHPAGEIRDCPEGQP